MKSEHEKANDKVEPVKVPVEAKQATQPVPATAPKQPAASSTTSLAEQLPEPTTQPSEQVQKEVAGKLKPLQVEYGDLAEKTRQAKGDPAKLAPLLARKGEVTREIDRLKRVGGIE